MEWLNTNKEWLFSGGGVTLLVLVVTWLLRLRKTKSEPKVVKEPAVAKRKANTKIMFVDDDPKFRVVSILKKAGWFNTISVKDIYNYDDENVKSTDIFFVDIQGVGKHLDCKDEGLGLALNLKKKYPGKKVIVYSAETKGDRFHEALRKADNFLAKNAEPYEFLELVDQYSKELFTEP